MFRVGLSGFRVFEKTQEVKIKPITLLTGTNSSGKSSFLAAVRFLSDLSGWGSNAASFNKDPFFLGSFDQIAHHRGGSYGRVEEFTLSYWGTPGEDGYRIPRIQEERKPQPLNVSVTYRRRFGQPAISSLSIRNDVGVISLKYDQDWLSATLKTDRADVTTSITLSEKELPPPDLVGTHGIYLTSAMENALFQRRSETRDVNAFAEVREITADIRDALSIVPQTGFAGAPVRTRPFRTYDPTDSAPQSEGSHVPSRMAQLARTRPTDWAKTREEIVAFGKKSGLFNNFDLRRLGGGDSDPFQVNVSVNGPMRNIVDVGYGISQAIPIVFELARRIERSIYLFQQPEIHLHPEAQAALATYIVENAVARPGYILIETHSDFIIDRVRRHVRDSVISREDVSLLYFHRDAFCSKIFEIGLSDTGEVVDSPEEYREFFFREQVENLGF